jgi:hypothetical protein
MIGSIQTIRRMDRLGSNRYDDDHPQETIAHSQASKRNKILLGSDFDCARWRQT